MKKLFSVFCMVGALAVFTGCPAKEEPVAPPPVEEPAPPDDVPDDPALGDDDFGE